MSDPLLSLDTLIERPAIRIDGIRYEMLSPDELSLADSHRFALWARRIEELQAGEADIDDELGEIVAQIVRLVMPGLPDDVFAKLSEENRLAVTQVFTGLLLRKRLGVAEATARAMGEAQKLATGAKSSPGSSGFSAEPPKPGFMRRLLRW